MSNLRSLTIRKGKRQEKSKPFKHKKRHDAFKIHVIIEATEEKFTLDDVYNDMKISQLKDELEFATGIPLSIQRLSYLDEGELQDHTDVKSSDFVPGCIVQLKVWPMYRELIEAVVANEIDWVFRLGVTNPSDYHTPASDYMTKRARATWLEERGFIALCLAAHRGHEELVLKLINSGVNVNRKTPTGKTPLHLASATGYGEIVNTLLYNGADINAEDQNGYSALTVAERFGSKVCSRYLFQFQWQQRAKDIKPSKKDRPDGSKPSKSVPMFAHQYHDSAMPVWIRGGRAQVYFSKILKPGEFEGTALNAPKGGHHPSLAHKKLRNATYFRDSPDSNASELDDYFPDESGVLPPINKKKKSQIKRPPTYEEWLAKQKEIERKIALENKKQNEEEMRKKMEEEEKKKEETEKLGYEKWLAQREQEKLERSPRHSSPVKHAASSLGGGDGYASSIGAALTVHHDGALRVYLRSLGRSKAGVAYEDWLNEKEMEINSLVRQMGVRAPAV
ncbi:ankyrin repeat domain-containing protein 60 [Elysia marginata]|uniref:Ankyrin repeat domain-containing protein 60 n=1 Tax=Elysia marginata TaxID=1093978 RepID=A0AAV4H8D5_9GAST|nr:ankyrin repeat domain-containing protein 60 [Elysia marginata]